MATADIVAKVNDPTFYSKVYFLAFTTGQQVASEPVETPDHAARVLYAQYVFMGKENAALLAAHVVASNATIQSTIDAGNEPPDNDILFALASIWTARANALGAV